MVSIFDKNYKVVKDSLLCPQCKKTISAELILENSSLSWPRLDWIYFNCPLCKRGSHVEVKTDRITTGELDGAPGPIFYPFSSQNIADFDVYTTVDYIECVYNGRRYRFNSKK